jgi:hypothetical protein
MRLVPLDTQPMEAKNTRYLVRRQRLISLTNIRGETTY